MQNYNNITDAGAHACACVQGNEIHHETYRVFKFNPPMRPIEFNTPFEFNRAVGLRVEDALQRFSVRSSIFNPTDPIEINRPIELNWPQGWIERENSGCIETALIARKRAHTGIQCIHIHRS